MTNETARGLEQLSARFRELGFNVREAHFFADNGLLIGTSTDELLVSSVALYFADGRLRARLAQHGGTHWEKRLATETELEAAALEALQTNERPPTPQWLVDW